MSLIAGGIHGPLCHFDHICETDLLESAVYVFYIGFELSEDGRSNNRYHLFSFTYVLQNIEGL